jgi:hypothetical protein
MATDKKHIAVYLAPEVEQALIVFCQEKGLISKKGTMYSAGVNATLAQLLRIADTEASNTPSTASNIPSDSDNTPVKRISTIPSSIGNIPSNTPSEALAVEVMPGKLRA